MINIEKAGESKQSYSYLFRKYEGSPQVRLDADRAAWKTEKGF